MKQFLVFAGLDYYADGGWNDFRCARDTLDEADQWLITNQPSTIDKYHNGAWAQIVDQLRGEIIKSYEGPRWDEPHDTWILRENDQ